MKTHRILVVSEGPPPLGDTAAEGGALRAWGLAKGLAAHGFTVTFAYRSTFKMADNAQDAVLPERISVSTWDGTTLSEVLRRHRIIIMRYAMGEAHEFTARLEPHHILVSDSYIPISVEVAARRSSDQFENDNYLRLQESSAIAARRADYFLYASPVQKMYYIGYLAGINKLNPTTYDELERRMFEVPYGVDPADKPTKLLKQRPEQPTLLWYGAFYSWFDMESLIDSLLRLKRDVPDFKLLIAGAKNPYNKDPGILAHYEKTMKALERLGDDVIEHIGWHPYDQRFEVYAQASAIITYNHLGLENRLAWRTRLMDFVLSDRPIITNGGDPLGEDLIERGIAFRADANEVEAVFKQVLANPPSQQAFAEAADRYAWINITEGLAAELKQATNMPVAEMLRTAPLRVLAYHYLKRTVKRVVLLPWTTGRHLKKHGLAKTLRRALAVIGFKGR